MEGDGRNILERGDICIQRICLQRRRPRFNSWVGKTHGEGIGYPLQYSWASLVAQLVKICLQCRRPGFDPCIGKIPWRRKWQTTPVFLPGKCHGQRAWRAKFHEIIRVGHNLAAAAESLQSCPTLCDPIDGSPPGSPIPGILQARTLEWVAISFSNA